jgi:tRNA (cytidine/uridine-2'-O-)-methyltransferase
MRVALFQPDIPQNLGTILRLGACLAVPIDVIGPTGFPVADRGLKRAGMDYADRAAMTQHESWKVFCDAERVGRLILITTKATALYQEFNFRPDDSLLFGSESHGVPNAVHDAADHRLRIPMTVGMRSLNVAVAVAMVVGEGLRQTGHLPHTPVPA